MLLGFFFCGFCDKNVWWNFFWVYIWDLKSLAGVNLSHNEIILFNSSLCGSVLTVFFNCVLKVLLEGRSFPRIFTGWAFPMAWQEAFLEDIKTAHHGLPVSRDLAVPTDKGTKETCLKKCEKYCPKGKLESHRWQNCPVVLQYFY